MNLPSTLRAEFERVNGKSHIQRGAILKYNDANLMRVERVDHHSGYAQVRNLQNGKAVSGPWTYRISRMETQYGLVSPAPIRWTDRVGNLLGAIGLAVLLVGVFVGICVYDALRGRKLLSGWDRINS